MSSYQKFYIIGKFRKDFQGYCSNNPMKFLNEETAVKEAQRLAAAQEPDGDMRFIVFEATALFRKEQVIEEDFDGDDEVIIRPMI